MYKRIENIIFSLNKLFPTINLIYVNDKMSNTEIESNITSIDNNKENIVVAFYNSNEQNLLNMIDSFNLDLKKINIIILNNSLLLGSDLPSNIELDIIKHIKVTSYPSKELNKVIENLLILLLKRSINTTELYSILENSNTLEVSKIIN